MRGRQPLAMLVTTLGVVGIFVFASVRQNEQTRALGRRWVGERWDIARRCIVGTPVGRSDPESVVADRLVAGLFETLASLEDEDSPPDLAAIWPARCTPLLSRLHADPSVTGGDVSRPLAQLEVLMARAIELDDVGQSVRNVRELADSIHTLDTVMPAGAEYDPDHFEAPGVRAALIEQSLAHVQHEEAPRAPGFLVGSETPTAPPQLSATFDRPIRAAVGCGDAAWVVAVGAGDTDEARAPVIAHFVTADGAAQLRPQPPSVGVVWACDEQAAVFLWSDQGSGRSRVWGGTVCDVDRCRPTPELHAPSVQVAVAGSRVHAVSPGRHTDLPLWRQLTGDRWTAQQPVAYGALSADERGILLHVAERNLRFTGQ